MLFRSERLGRFALSLHPEKTRLIEFGRFAAERRQRRALGKPETFNFLGFTFPDPRTGEMAVVRRQRLLQLPCSANQRTRTARLPTLHRRSLAAHAAAA